MTLRHLLYALAIAMLVVTTGLPGQASVTFDPLTGTGFVGKGDVQEAYGWNNARLQANAAGVSFFYASDGVYDVTIEWYTGPEKNRKQHQVEVAKNVSVDAAITCEARTMKQITGFILTGFGETLNQGSIPQVGDTILDNDNIVKTIVAVEQVSSTGGFYVTYEGNDVLLQ